MAQKLNQSESPNEHCYKGDDLEYVLNTKCIDTALLFETHSTSRLWFYLQNYIIYWSGHSDELPPTGTAVTYVTQSPIMYSQLNKQ